MSQDLLIPSFLSALDDRRAGAEEVAVIEAAAGDAQLVDVFAFVALPEPVERFRWRQNFGAVFWFRAGGESGVLLRSGGRCDWNLWREWSFS